ncbi:hypothetical protein HELRODRAFT_192266 [Helobdella robusta]|uniref:RRM domain-containing protein n=1 Tax=Helobdella robusta TaxID=6412 RepID=T1FTS0_HELRO|nr:hypothetical protein HELRODRAFT_192266 [Helobdella robusta]ESO01242.1 hypothetical protein HELRODRAFT_192266 [Helobdella robusta]
MSNQNQSVRSASTNSNNSSCTISNVNIVSNSSSSGNNTNPNSNNMNNSSVKDVTKVRLHVSNIPYDLRWQDLKDLFKDKVGSDVCYVEIYEGIDGKSTGAGVIEIKGRELADRAIELLHKTELKNRQIIVREEKEKDRLQYGKLQNPSSSMNHDHMNGVMGGTAVGGAINNATNSISLGLQLLYQLGIDTENITNQIFIANLDYNVTAKKLKDVFIMAGSILQVDLKVDKEGSSRGMATIRYESPIEAVQAITMFNGQYLYERLMNVRMDKMSESSPQFIPNILPAGLKGVGIGLGVGGQPLLNVGHIANAMVLSQLISLTASGGFLNASPLQPSSAGNSLAVVAAAATQQSATNNNHHNYNSYPRNSNIGGPLSSMCPLPPSSRNFNPLQQQNPGALLSNIAQSGVSMDAGSGGSGFNILNELRSYNWPNPNFGFANPRLPNSYHNGGYYSHNSPHHLPHHLPHHHHQQQMYAGGGGGMARQHGDGTTVIVKNLPYSTTWQHLKDRFKEAGDIQYVDIKMENGKSKGIGSVRFSNADTARRAVSILNGTKIDGRQIEVKFEL